MNNLMIDLETMGKNKDAPIVSIGAVFFTPETGDIGQEFYTVVSLESAMEQGATPDGDTILWWLKQSLKHELQSVLMILCRSAMHSLN